MYVVHGNIENSHVSKRSELKIRIYIHIYVLRKIDIVCSVNVNGTGGPGLQLIRLIKQAETLGSSALLHNTITVIYTYIVNVPHTK